MNYKIIEIFGLPGVGKTTFEIRLKKYLKSEKKMVLNRREIITNYAFSKLNNNLLDYICLTYFKIIEKYKNKGIKANKIKFDPIKIKKKIKSKNFFSNFFRERYIKICEKLYSKYFENNSKNKKIIEHLINKIEPKNRNLISFWIYEMFAAYYIFIQKKTNLIYLSDEGFNQRCFLILFSKLKNKKLFLNKYYKACPKPDLCIYLKRNLNKIKNVHTKRKIDKSGIFLSQNQIRDFIKFEKLIYLKFKNDIKFVKLHNSNRKIKLHKILK